MCAIFHFSGIADRFTIWDGTMVKTSTRIVNKTKCEEKVIWLVSVCGVCVEFRFMYRSNFHLKVVCGRRQRWCKQFLRSITSTHESTSTAVTSHANIRKYFDGDRSYDCKNLNRFYGKQHTVRHRCDFNVSQGKHTSSYMHDRWPVNLVLCFVLNKSDRN